VAEDSWLHSVSLTQLQAFIKGNLGYVEVMFDGKVEPVFYILPPETYALKDSDAWCKATLQRMQASVVIVVIVIVIVVVVVVLHVTVVE
jgi:hypothetical protein